MARSLLLIKPCSDHTSYYSSEVFTAMGLGRCAYIGDLASTTVAALAAPHLNVELLDEDIQEIDFDHPAEFVGITGTYLNYRRMIFLADEFRRRGKIVLMGGPFVSMSPARVRDHCDILVQGELEDIGGQLFDDLARNDWSTHYCGTRPNLENCPVPRWDLYPNSHAICGALQASRGCPHNCEFCDVIHYLGRHQRYKTTAQVWRELDNLYHHGYRSVFLSDDNFIGHRSKAGELVEAMGTWNRQRENGRVSFITQLSIDVACDTELLMNLANAGIDMVFVGIETPNKDSLQQSNKVQNLKMDLGEAVERCVGNGIAIMAGIMVGFDGDGPDIFRRQADFINQLPLPICMIGAVEALDGTDLRARLEKEGRLTEMSEGFDNGMGATPWRTNILPLQMSQRALLQGMLWLYNNVYSVEAFGQRLLRFIDVYGREGLPSTAGRQAFTPVLHEANMDVIRVARYFVSLGPAELMWWGRLCRGLRQKPGASRLVLGMIVNYLQVRHMLHKCNLWQPDLAGRDPFQEL